MSVQRQSPLQSREVSLYIVTSCQNAQYIRDLMEGAVDVDVFNFDVDNKRKGPHEFGVLGMTEIGAEWKYVDDFRCLCFEESAYFRSEV